MERLSDLLRQSAERHPDADAVVLGAERLSYAALDAAANRWARSLQRHGVARGDRVALWLPKSLHTVAAIYGILRAGAAYVPLDPTLPLARLELLLKDGDFAGLVTTADRLGRMATLGAKPARAVWVTGDSPREDVVSLAQVDAESGADCPERARPEDPAYVLYTSGSTGEPKGVLLSHAAALAFVRWAAAEFALSPSDRLANFAPFQFDLSTFDLFAAAWAGAAVHPVAPRVAPFARQVVRTWREERITCCYLTPSTLAWLQHEGGAGQHEWPDLRLVLFAGEPMPPGLLREWMARIPHARFVNLYGPTETNVCTWFPVTAPPVDDTPLPIGRPSCGDEVWLLDEHQQPVRDGETGELWISGPTLMMGYWNQPEQTAAVLREIEPTPGRRVQAYRTGDLGRWLPDGNLAYLGRRDQQVKIRGHRVELGGVEACLRRHTAVEEAVALPFPGDGGQRLAAALTLRPGSVIAREELRRHCAEALPAAWVPERILVVEALPRTSSGKLDRRALTFQLTAVEQVKNG